MRDPQNYSPCRLYNFKKHCISLNLPGIFWFDRFCQGSSCAVGKSEGQTYLLSYSICDDWMGESRHSSKYFLAWFHLNLAGCAASCSYAAVQGSGRLYPGIHGTAISARGLLAK